MNTSLSHLPQNKQQQILQVADIIKEVVHPEKIVLFGSYATGSWVEDHYYDEGIRYSYISDYDFLVVTTNDTEKEYLLTDRIINRARNITDIAVNPIIHTIDYINEGLSFGQYFFSDIVKEGVLLYDNGREGFTTPKTLTPEEQKEVARRYFDQWYVGGSKFLRYALFAKQDAEENNQNLNEVAFLLHQATERFYNTVLLVFTGYKPKTHSLEKLRQYAKPYSKELMLIFPDNTDHMLEIHLFDLLKRGYIDARYKQDYVITGDELTALIKRVQAMQGVVEEMCREKISALI